MPRHLLDDDRYLERNLGGWAPVWFDALGLDDAAIADPVLRARETLVDHGSHITSAGSTPARSRHGWSAGCRTVR